MANPTPEEIEQYLRQLVGNQGADHDDDECSCGEDHSEMIETSLMASNARVGIANDPTVEYYLPVLTFDIEGEITNQLGIALKEPQLSLHLLQGLLAVLLDKEGCESIRQVFVKEYERMRATEARPRLIEMIESGNYEGEAKAALMRRPHDD